MDVGRRNKIFGLEVSGVIIYGKESRMRIKFELVFLWILSLVMVILRV